MKNIVKKTFLVTILALAAGIAQVAITTPEAKAQVRRFDRDISQIGYGGRDYYRDNRFYGGIYSRGLSNYRFPVRFYSDRDFFTRHNIFRRYPRLYRSFPSYFAPRQFVIVDRSDISRSFVIRNSLTGPFSVNRAIIRVDRDFYDRFSDFDFDQDIDIDVDTGGNIVRFNTVTGSIETGDVDIEID